MIDPKRLLDDLKRVLKGFEDDLRQRAESVEAMQTTLQREYGLPKKLGALEKPSRSGARVC